MGSTSLSNTHPFVYGRWIFAHNGTLQNFAARKQLLLDAIPNDLRQLIRGDTDSEHVFMLWLVAAIVFILVTLSVRRYLKQERLIPSGFMNGLEFVVEFIRDSIVRPLALSNTNVSGSACPETPDSPIPKFEFTTTWSTRSVNGFIVNMTPAEEASTSS